MGGVTAVPPIESQESDATEAFEDNIETELSLSIFAIQLP